MRSVNPYLNFNGNTEKAFKFYQSIFGGELDISRYKDLDDNMGATGDALNLVANAALPIGANTTLFGSDILESIGQTLNAGNDFYINLQTESLEETEQLFQKLAEDGEVQMPLGHTGWAEQFGMVRDKFGIRWMVYYTG
ncbi:VOC family protein [Gracilimonas tropica]|uniref:VOC family protein n=1 Tax=Gracilimonas tropica TaxID=454600 RepID=UPI00036D56FF|nr:VOC family protein [Gracilimonas tropica]